MTPTNSPSTSCTRTGSTASEATTACPNDTVFFTAVPPSIIGGSPRTLPSGADEAGVTAVKFYELRDILRGKMARVTEADDLAVVEVVVLAEQCDASGGGPEVDVTE